MAALIDTLRARIAESGPLPVSTYMAAANAAYYAKGTAFGAAGDFITAPDISQTFGEMIGLWCAATWAAMGAPYPVLLVECGPGRGTLMQDLLRATAGIEGFNAAVRVHLVEQSPALRASQAYALSEIEPHWHDTLSTVPPGPMLLVANEFLDALPIRQYERTAQGWRERAITVDSAGALSFTAIDSGPAPVPIPLAAGADLGAVFEHCETAHEAVRAAAQRVCAHGGAALFIDYGHKASALGETLQAVRRHGYHSVLSDPGEADLTAHVDFAALAATARSRGARVHGPIEQGLWLRALGILMRLATLARGKPAAVGRDVHAGVRRLIEPDAMGALFKVMAVSHPSLATLDGFAQAGDNDHR
ncbi:MAG: SAM-dependent methyltransferase [Rhodospirillaceae bacterium]|nr:SAM-dependent methyltransferase [Rhodospirillaceae bacterium]